MTTTKQRRTWPQRLTIVMVIVTAFACFAAAGSLAAGQWVLSQRKLIELAEPTTQHGGSGRSAEVIIPGASTTLPRSGADVSTTTIVLAEPEAANFLVAGADNGDCVGDGNGDRDDLGERSDTIMIWRANPDTNQLAVLSLPRDLYVDIAGGRRARINSAYRRDDPARLIDTINLNFGIPIDHYVQIDFCAFRRLVDAVGGVAVPFEFPARDRGAGLDVPEAGCVTLDGDMALAYVRSRHYQFEDPPGSGDWREDGTSDFGRIARQQDFLRRVVAKIIDDGLYKPSVATALIDTNREYLVTDTGLTVRRLLEFANTLRNLDPAAITTYRIESSSETIGGQEVEIPRPDGSNMQAILAVFRGQAALASAPDQVFELTTTAATTPPVAADTDADADADDDAVAPLPTVVAEENVVGVAPTRDLSCE
jgi:LCP family protein required for cell wall assembly